MERLPNLFESYDQPENKLTFALLRTLASDGYLTRSFLRWAVPSLSVSRDAVSVYSQRRPAAERGIRARDPGIDPTVPDGWIAGDELLVALEVKRDRNALREEQLRGHLRALGRRDAASKALLILSPDDEKPPVLEKLERWADDRGISLSWRSWQDAHGWTCQITGQLDRGRGKTRGIGSFFLGCLREYLEMSELSRFAGVTFDGGYDYRRAKALLKSLRQELQPDIIRWYRGLTNGRPKITDDGTLVWDIFAKTKHFTQDPHLTFSIHDTGLYLSLTVPDKARSTWRTLSRLARERTLFEGALKDFLRTVLRVSRTTRPAVLLNLMQRHWRTISSHPTTDARFIVRLDTASICPSSLRGRGVRKHDDWYEAVLTLLASGKKKANWEFQIQTYFNINQPITSTPRLKAEMVRIVKALHPLYELVSSSS